MVTVALGIWIFGCVVGSIIISNVRPMGILTDNLDILEEAALVAFWPLLVTTIILLGAGVCFYGWYLLMHRLWCWTKIRIKSV